MEVRQRPSKTVPREGVFPWNSLRTLGDLGWNSFFESYFEEFKQSALLPARVVEELKGLYRVRSAQAEYLAEAAGKLQHNAVSRDDLPAVGDWVAIIARPEEGRARIEHILPRRTKLARKVAGGR